MEKFIIGAYWKNRPLQSKEYLTFVKNYLRILTHFNKQFSKFYAWGGTPTAGCWLDENLNNFDKVVFNHINDEDIKYQNSDPNNWEITLESKSPIGYMEIFSAKKDTPEEIAVSISAGALSENIVNSIIVSFDAGSEGKSNNFLYSLFKLTLNYCNPEYAIIISQEFRQKQKVEGVRINVGWLTYFADSSISKYLPSGTNYEMLQEGGVLIKLKDEKPSAESQEDVSAAIKIRDSLINNGITRWDQFVQNR